MNEYNITIKGKGTLEDIVKSLELMAHQLWTMPVHEVNGAEYIDCSFTLQIEETS